MKSIIVIEGGIVQSVYTDADDLDVEIVDLDTEDPDELKETEERLEEVERDKSLRDIY